MKSSGRRSCNKKRSVTQTVNCQDQCKATKRKILEETSTSNKTELEDTEEGFSGYCLRNRTSKNAQSEPFKKQYKKVLSNKNGQTQETLQDEVVSSKVSLDSNSRNSKKKTTPDVFQKAIDADELLSISSFNSRRHSMRSDREIVQPTVNGLKKANQVKQHETAESSSTSKRDSCIAGSSGGILCQMPSKINMFSENVKHSIVNKFAPSFHQPAASAGFSRRHDNLLHFIDENSLGLKSAVRQRKVVLKGLSDRISDFRLVRTASPFDRRCTAMAWHPWNPNLLVIGSKGGDIILMDLENSNRDVFMQGCGLGGVIQAMKFLPDNSSSMQLLTASMDGTVILRDVATQAIVTTFVDTSDLIHQFWYCSCDVGPRGNMVVHGDSLGRVTLQTLDGEKIWSQKLHRAKVNHTEFHRKQEWLLCTASTDQFVSLWDIRMLKNHDSYLAKLKHEKGVNSAYFSPTNGARLLTTDQHHELRVYDCGSWNLEQTIIHPHRFYQHLTPMKAAWHPLEDLIVCGHYPDKNLPDFKNDDERGIDFIDSFSTKRVCHLYDPMANGIVTLAQFNNIGSTIAATMGYTILIWQRDDSGEMNSETQTADQPYDFNQKDNSGSSLKSSKPPTKTKLGKNAKSKLSS